MTKQLTTLVFASMLFAACDQVGGWGDLFDSGYDSFDSGTTFTATPQIAEMSYGCDVGSPDTWWFRSGNDGWAGDMTLDIYETGDGRWPSNPTAVWDETHNMKNTEWAEDGSWDVWELSLRDVERYSDQTAGSTTLFSCRWNDGGSLAFMATIYDESSRVQDCAIWGHESQQYFNDYRGYSCVCFDGDGSCTN